MDFVIDEGGGAPGGSTVDGFFYCWNVVGGIAFDGWRVDVERFLKQCHVNVFSFERVTEKS